MTAILGISAFYHDSAAALVVDGELVAAAQEERFTRKKHDARFPKHAVDYCLKEEMVAGIGDFFIRRTGMLFFERPALADLYKKMHHYICDRLGYNETVSARLLEAFEKEYFGVVAFKTKQPTLTE